MLSSTVAAFTTPFAQEKSYFCIFWFLQFFGRSVIRQENVFHQNKMIVKWQFDAVLEPWTCRKYASLPSHIHQSCEHNMWLFIWPYLGFYRSILEHYYKWIECFEFIGVFPMQNAGRIQEWLAGTRVRSYGTRRPKTKGFVYHRTHVQDPARSQQVVGLVCLASHSHFVQDYLLHYSQDQGESFAVVLVSPRKENSSPSQQAGFAQEKAVFSFHEASTYPFVVFPRRP